jgi:very-short-patch-repair endonuclease
MKLWHALRVRRLGGFKFIRQGSIGRYVTDFVCREKNLVIDVDGVDSKRDRVRDVALLAKGYRIIRFSNSEILGNTDGVLEKLYEVLCSE